MLTWNKAGLYPNPAHSVFGLSKDMGVKQVTLYTLAGKRISKLQSNFGDMNIGDIPLGLYMVHVVANDGLMVKSLKIE